MPGNRKCVLCQNSSSLDTRVPHIVPQKDLITRKKWFDFAIATGASWPKSADGRYKFNAEVYICQYHFTPDSYYPATAKQARRLKNGALPTIPEKFPTGYVPPESHYLLGLTTPALPPGGTARVPQSNNASFSAASGQQEPCFASSDTDTRTEESPSTHRDVAAPDDSDADAPSAAKKRREAAADKELQAAFGLEGVPVFRVEIGGRATYLRFGMSASTIGSEQVREKRKKILCLRGVLTVDVFFTFCGL